MKIIFNLGKKIYFLEIYVKMVFIRPHIVWFGEDVPLMLKAISICEKADILIIVNFYVYTPQQVYETMFL